jgi:hypothetical protein
MNYFLWFFLVVSLIFQQTGYATYRITSPERIDGFGAQFQTLIYSVIFAELNDFKFVYTPFGKMEHNYDNDPNFIARKEWLINFIDNFEINEGDATKLTVSNAIQFFEQNLVRCINSRSLQKIKKLFKTNKNRNDYFNDAFFNIVVHVRRYNPHDNRLYGPHLPDDVFLQVIKNLREIYASKNPLFHIQSQGKEENFKEYLAPDVVLHLNESVEDSFISMVLADVLVTSPSSYSYTAGIISDAIVYYMPFWHPPLPGWKLVEDLVNKHIT